MNEDFNWFIEQYKNFQRIYGNSFIAIKDKRVLGVYKTYAEGVKETIKKEKIGTFIVQECSTKTEAYNCYIASTNFIS